MESRSRLRQLLSVPMRLSVHHPKLNVPVLWWRSVGSTHTAYVMETLIDEIAVATKQDPVAYRMKLMGTGMSANWMSRFTATSPDSSLGLYGVWVPLG